MTVTCLHHKEEIEKFLCQDIFLYLYNLGDLDDFFWPYTTWYALKDQARIQQLALLYTQTSLPVLLGLAREPTHLMEQLLREIIHLLPRRFYAHLSGTAVQVLKDEYQVRSHGLHYKMALTDTSQLLQVDTSAATPLSSANERELADFYRLSYPGNWFEPRMLATGYYYGIRQRQDLVAVAGVHVYSQPYKVAALGNIAVHPQFRSQGFGKIICAKVCQTLLSTVQHIGLNVKADNIAAIRCYEKLGFEPIATYEEYSLVLKPTAI